MTDRKPGPFHEAVEGLDLDEARIWLHAMNAERDGWRQRALAAEASLERLTAVHLDEALYEGAVEAAESRSPAIPASPIPLREDERRYGQCAKCLGIGRKTWFMDGAAVSAHNDVHDHGFEPVEAGEVPVDPYQLLTDETRERLFSDLAEMARIRRNAPLATPPVDETPSPDNPQVEGTAQDDHCGCEGFTTCRWCSHPLKAHGHRWCSMCHEELRLRRTRWKANAPLADHPFGCPHVLNQDRRSVVTDAKGYAFVADDDVVVRASEAAVPQTPVEDTPPTPQEAVCATCEEPINGAGFAWMHKSLPESLYDHHAAPRKEEAEDTPPPASMPERDFLRSVVEQVHRDTHDALAEVPVATPPPETAVDRLLEEVEVLRGAHADALEALMSLPRAWPGCSCDIEDTCRFHEYTSILEDVMPTFSRVADALSEIAEVRATPFRARPEPTPEEEPAAGEWATPLDSAVRNIIERVADQIAQGYTTFSWDGRELAEAVRAIESRAEARVRATRQPMIDELNSIASNEIANREEAEARAEAAEASEARLREALGEAIDRRLAQYRKYVEEFTASADQGEGDELWVKYLRGKVTAYEYVIEGLEGLRALARPSEEPTREESTVAHDHMTVEELIRVRIFAIREKQRRKGYDASHDREHVANDPHVCIGLVSQYMAAGRWEDAAALAVAFAEAAYLNEHPSEEPEEVSRG